MADFQNYEFMVGQKIEGKWRVYRILAILGYIAFPLIFLALAVRVRLLLPVFALVPIFLWMLVFFTWRYTSPEYELATVSNSLRFTIVYGNRTRRPQFEVEFRRMHKIAPYDARGKADVERFAPDKVYCAASSMHVPNLYYAIWEEDKKHYVLFFETNDRLLKICKYYNGAATVLPTDEIKH